VSTRSWSGISLVRMERKRSGESSIDLTSNPLVANCSLLNRVVLMALLNCRGCAKWTCS
jgi:hypothetical protein